MSSLLPQPVSDLSSRAELFLAILHQLGHEVGPGSMLLDFGCGSGMLVRAFRDQGLQAFGCDIELGTEPSSLDLQQSGLIKRIDLEPYRLPFADASMDLIVSDQVMEHVADYQAAVGEMFRVLKPGGACLHIFPSRYRLIEPHSFVPLATLVRTAWWLRLWARLGVRNENQGGQSVDDTVNGNLPYLRERTNYLTRRELRREVTRFFPEAHFCEQVYMAASGGKLGSLAGLPLMPRAYSAFKSRVLLMGKAAVQAPATKQRSMAEAEM